MILGTTLESESLFTYQNGKTHKDYVTDHDGFVPKFLDEVEQGLMDSAVKFCNGTEDRQCLVDYIFTGSQAVAQGTQDVQIQAKETEAVLGKLQKKY